MARSPGWVRRQVVPPSVVSSTNDCFLQSPTAARQPTVFELTAITRDTRGTTVDVVGGWLAVVVVGEGVVLDGRSDGAGVARAVDSEPDGTGTAVGGDASDAGCRSRSAAIRATFTKTNPPTAHGQLPRRELGTDGSITSQVELVR